ncbi:MAG: hypothetical protein JXB29_11280 [Sedimentisphaerales bacterium]|nr:hypothetical protein [Sedimentisphaerales bacterium]
MNTRHLAKITAATIAVLILTANPACADNLKLQEKLSQPLNIQLNTVTITEALEQIGKKAGISFVLSEEAVWKLPNGKATRLSVSLTGPLADSMTEMLNAFFMRYAVGDEKITIYSRPQLKHILGRPTAKQLELLQAIYTNPITTYIVGDSQKTINDALGQEIVILPVEYYDVIYDVLRELAEVVPEGKELTPGESWNLSTPITLAQLLDQLTLRHRRQETEWYVSGMYFQNQTAEIRLVTTKEFGTARLDQIVDISFKDELAEQIIQKLAGWTGMELHIFKRQPEWLTEEITVDMQNVKLGQALLNIVTTVDGQVNLDISRNTITIQQPKPIDTGYRSSRTAKEKSEKAVESDYVGKISIPMDEGKYYLEFMLRENDLTEKLKKLRNEKLKEVLGKEQSPQRNREKQKGQK